MTTSGSHISHSRSRYPQCWLPCNWPTIVRSTITMMGHHWPTVVLNEDRFALPTAGRYICRQRADQVDNHLPTVFQPTFAIWDLG